MIRSGRDRLSGVVEVDETYIGGKRTGKRGRGAAGKALVIIAAEDQGNCIGRIRLRQVLNASAESLTPAVKDVVSPGSIIKTDGWDWYLRLPFEGYNRQIVRQTSEVGDNLLPVAHRVASLLKRWLKGTHHGAVPVISV
jgi:transposase-like protein